MRWMNIHPDMRVDLFCLKSMLKFLLMMLLWNPPQISWTSQKKSLNSLGKWRKKSPAVKHFLLRKNLQIVTNFWFFQGNILWNKKKTTEHLTPEMKPHRASGCVSDIYMLQACQVIFNCTLSTPFPSIALPANYYWHWGLHVEVSSFSRTAF